nr:GTP-binding protein [Variovorax sp. PBS-H4]
MEHICDDIAVMYPGQIVERAPRRSFFARPLHPYSVALMSAVPPVSGGRRRAAHRIKLTLERQLRAADLVVINKVDSVTKDELARVRQWVSSVAGRLPQYETSQSRLPRMLREGMSLPATFKAGGCADASCTHEDHADHDRAAHDHGELFDTWSCQPGQVFDADMLRAWLRDTPTGLLRLKGVLRTGEATWSEIQFAGRHGALRKADAPAEGAAVVAIGLRGRLPLSALEAVFAASA